MAFVVHSGGTSTKFMLAEVSLFKLLSGKRLVLIRRHGTFLWLETEKSETKLPETASIQKGKKKSQNTGKVQKNTF